jgi:long-chain acyl-CoA synthetase
MMQFADRLRHILTLDPAAMALEYENTTFSWGDLSQMADKVAKAVADAGARPYDVVGWAAENAPTAIGSYVGLLLSDHGAAVLNPHMAPKILGEELQKEKFAVIVGDAHFWAIPGLVDAAKAAGSAGILLKWTADEASATAIAGLEKVGAGAHREPMPDLMVELISSGTTGPPKRTPQTKQSMLNQLALGERKEAGADNTIALKRSPSIIFRSLAHGGGAFAVSLALYSARPISLHEKFSVVSTIDAIKRHRPKVASFVPTMIKMIWDADVPVESLSSLIAIRSGTAPLDAELQAQFEEKYGVPILVDYGASEFGGVAAWTLADHKQFAKQKRGSVGRVVAGSKLRVVNQETREEIKDGSNGILEIQVSRLGDQWISTNDLASLDSDGFLFIRGRADDAIMRGGFKVLPDDIAAVLRQHPDIQDVAVVGIPDERLGQAPVAVIELKPGHAAPDAAALKAFARDHLTAYQTPVNFKFVDSLPRTASMKVARAEVLKLAQA